VKVEWELPENQIQTFLHADGILGAFPYGGSRYRLMADVGGAHPDEAPPTPTLEQFQRIVDERGPQGTRISEPVWLAGFRSHLRHVKETKHGRVFLTGDAAHIHSPAGGQGMNTGMQDAANLAWKLALVVQGRAGEELLDTYPVERLPVAESVLKMSDTMLKMATMKGNLTRKLRDQLVPFLINKEVVQRRFRNQVSEIAIHYRHSPIVQEHRSPLQRVLPHSVHAGDRAPDVTLPASGSHGERRLFDLVRGPRHSLLLLLDEAPGDEFRWDILQRWEQLVETCVVASGDVQDALPYGQAILDPQHAIRERFGIGTGSLLLIRPDGYIGYLSDTLQLEPLDAYLREVLRLN
jgi:hypothetical protein